MEMLWFALLGLKAQQPLQIITLWFFIYWYAKYKNLQPYSIFRQDGGKNK